MEECSMMNLNRLSALLLLADSAKTGIDLTPAIVYLSGGRRGITQRLSGASLDFHLRKLAKNFG